MFNRSPTALSIWDLDNCLSNDGWRIRFIDVSQQDVDDKFREYHSRCAHDNVGNLELFQALTANTLPVFITSRPNEVRAQTRDWIHRKLDKPTYILLMRPDRNHKPSLVLKRRAVEALLSTHPPIVSAFDDRHDIVNMYRELGLNAAQLWIHDVPLPHGFEAGAKPPNIKLLSADMPDAPPSRGDHKPGVAHCTYGVGCEQAGVCYAAHHGKPDECGIKYVPAPGTPSATKEEVQERERRAAECFENCNDYNCVRRGYCANQR